MLSQIEQLKLQKLIINSISDNFLGFLFYELSYGDGELAQMVERSLSM